MCATGPATPVRRGRARPGWRQGAILDELPTLHQVPSLQPGLAESRQFGGCFVLGVQVASALRDLYGRDGAETVSGLCGTRVVLAAPDRDTAQWSADSLGRSEVEEVAEVYSYGANTIRDGVSLTPRRELRALALPSEIMRLPSLGCAGGDGVIAGSRAGSIAEVHGPDLFVLAVCRTLGHRLSGLDPFWWTPDQLGERSP